MKFGRIPIDGAEGAILAHSLTVPGRRYKKGHVLAQADLRLLAAAGHRDVMAARLEVDDVDEDSAAQAIADACRGPGARTNAAFTGRCNIYAEVAGVAVIDRARIDAINLIDEAVTIATVAPFEAVRPGQMLATVKIIPFSAPATLVEEACARAAGARGEPVVRVAELVPRDVGLVLTRLPETKPGVLEKTVETVEARLAPLGSRLSAVVRCDHHEDAVGAAIGELLAGGAAPVLVFGASAITDRADVVPAGIVAAGGTIDHFGMPVDPGNLLLLGHLGDVPVIGLPGCARSPKLNGFDWVLRRVLAGIEVDRRDIMAMGGGGLLKEFAGRPQPRDGRIEAAAPRVPRIAGVVLAAGQSRRMGAANKLLAEIDGTAMVARVVDAVAQSQACPVVVVTGHQRQAVEAALAGRDVTFVHNPDYGAGLSGSLKTGIAALGAEIDGALVCLGDMPRVGADHLDKLIAAFAPVEGRAICLPTRDGKRGNPVLWGRQFFAEIGAIAGDVGARHLIGEYAELVREVAIDDDAIFIDIDTPEALADLRTATDPAP